MPIAAAETVERVWMADGSRQVDVRVIDGRALFEDIDLGTWEEVERDGMPDLRVRQETETGASSRRRRALIARHPLVWPQARIPYVFAEDYPEEGRDVFRRAAGQYQRQAGIRFVPRTTERDYVLVGSGSECSSRIGRMGGVQEIRMTATCMTSLRSNLHEMGHAAGLLHEHQRADRDDHITLAPGIDASGVSWYKRSPGHYEAVAPYDLASVMHYTAAQGAISRSSSSGVRRGVAVLSRGDVLGLAKLYPQAVRTVVKAAPKTTRSADSAARSGAVTSLAGDRCLEARTYGPFGDTRYLAMSACNGGQWQNWRLAPDGRFVNDALPGFCLTGTLQPRGVALMQACTDSPRQLWRWSGARLVNRASPSMELRYRADGKVQIDAACAGHEFDFAWRPQGA
ncbi:M12 family metallopeptidase [Paludibacterium paludis]|uniref:Peptidase M12A domain-containing protein n=1 Tax=Paludibacterium paludis TaxID=1225769 RepID=A0A918P652_9NEIS|nr:M12 family metallopeptidase [Paludibacterium paludis]GGY24072.1 hypothetical protein GCM10011289_29760 [Paludibacterium paludis]